MQFDIATLPIKDKTHEICQLATKAEPFSLLYQVGSFGPTQENFGVLWVNKTAAEPSESKYKKKEKTWDLLRVLIKL